MAQDTLNNNQKVGELSEDEKRDLGFGAVVTRGSRLRFLNQDGTFNVRRTGLSLFTSLNLYHSLLAMSWRTFLLLVLVLYFVSNIIFGALYALNGAGAIVDTSSEPLSSIYLRGF